MREALRRRVARGHVTLGRAVRARRRGRRERRSTRRASPRTSPAARASGAIRPRSRRSTSRTVLRMPDVVRRRRARGAAGRGRPAAARHRRARRRRAARRCAARKARGWPAFLDERLAHHRAARSTASRSARPSACVEQRDRLRHAVRELPAAWRSTSSGSRRRSRSSPTGWTWQRSCRASASHITAFRARARRARSRTASASGSASCSRRCCARRTRRAARRNDAAMVARRGADQGGARADPRAGGEPRVNPFPVDPLRAVRAAEDDDRPAAAGAAAGPRLLGLVHDAGAAAGRSGRDGLLFPVPRRVRRRAGAGRVRRVGGGAREPVRHAAERSGAGAGGGKARGDGHRRAGRAAVHARVSRSR